MHELFQLGIKALIKNKEGKYLLLRAGEKKSSYWDLPGGRLEKNETTLRALKREVEEETGLIIKVASSIGLFLTDIRIRLPSGNDNVGLIFSIHECTIEQTAPVVLSDEHYEYGWFEASEAEKLLAENYPPLFTKLIR